MSRLGAVFAVASVLLVACSSTEQSPPAAFEECADESLHTLAVRARVARREYRPGQVARFNVLVSRTVRTDEHDEGSGHDLGPVKGAEVALGATVEDVRLGSGGTTGEDGRTTIRLTVEDHVPPGVADVFIVATLKSTDLHCAPYETGHVEKPGFFRVIR